MKINRKLSEEDLTKLSRDPIGYFNHIIERESEKLTPYLMTEIMKSGRNYGIYGMRADIQGDELIIDIDNLSKPSEEKVPYVEPLRKDSIGQLRLLAYLPKTDLSGLRVRKEKDGYLGIYTDEFKHRVMIPASIREIEKRWIDGNFIEIVLR